MHCPHYCLIRQQCVRCSCALIHPVLMSSPPPEVFIEMRLTIRYTKTPKRGNNYSCCRPQPPHCIMVLFICVGCFKLMKVSMNQFRLRFCCITAKCVIYHFAVTLLNQRQSENGQIIFVFIVTDTKTYFAGECELNNLANYPGS